MRFRFAVLFVCFASFLAACSTESDTRETQRTAFETYLNGQSKAYELKDGVYRYIENIERQGRATEPQVAEGDRIVIDFALYSFQSGPSQLYYTNLPGLQDELINLNPQFWPTLPETIELGVTPLMKGLESGLIGCRQNDIVELYLTYDLGFGGRPVGIVPEETPLVWLIAIYEVTKP